VPPALPGARRRAVWPGSRSEPPRDQISVSGKVLPGTAASVGIESHRGLVVIPWRACSVRRWWRPETGRSGRPRRQGCPWGHMLAPDGPPSAADGHHVTLGKRPVDVDVGRQQPAAGVGAVGQPLGDPEVEGGEVDVQQGGSAMVTAGPKAPIARAGAASAPSSSTAAANDRTRWLPRSTAHPGRCRLRQTIASVTLRTLLDRRLS
jgi:hypothetical protein